MSVESFMSTRDLSRTQRLRRVSACAGALTLALSLGAPRTATAQEGGVTSSSGLSITINPVINRYYPD
jgi:hypothetical protein